MKKESLRSAYRSYVSLLFLIISSGTSAAIYYDESIQGDIAYSSSFNLEAGQNTFIGNVSGTDGANGIFDSDSFNATLPTGSILRSVQLDVTSAANSSPLSYFDVRVRDPNSSNWLWLSGSTNNDWLWISGIGTYRADINAEANAIDFIGINGFYDGMSYDYKLTIDVTQVPLFPSNLYFSTALLGFGLLRYKSRVRITPIGRPN